MAKHSQEKRIEASEILSGQPPALSWKLLLFQSLVIIAAGLWIYWPAFHGDWLWDDDELITQNTVVQDPGGLWKIWFEPGSLLDYQPIKFSVAWLQWRLWGNDTLGYHLTNVGLHLLGALLVWRLLSKLGLRLAWLGGLLFAIHPVMVESVAWIAELKNTLSLPFFLLSMGAWIDYDQGGKLKDYLPALTFFLIAMLCKMTMVMFPVVILLYAWWKRGRIGWKDVISSAPFFIISLVLGLITVWFLNHHARAELVALGGPLSRLACAGLAISFYFWKAVLPIGLLTIYPQWDVNPPTPEQFLPWLVLTGMIWWSWTKRRSWGRHVILGFGFFLVNLLPFLGFNAAAYMGFTWVMDHVLYLPIIGLIGLLVAGLEKMGERLSSIMHFFKRGAVAVVMILLAWESHAYAGLYTNLETLWGYTAKYNPDAFLAHNDLGFALAAKGRTDEAIAQFREALRINPRYPDAHMNLGLLLLQEGHVSEAITEFKASIEVDPVTAATHYDLGVALDRAGKISEAMEQYRQTIALDPHYINAYNNLAVALVGQKRLSEAIDVLEAALRIDPANSTIANNLKILQVSQTAAPPH